LPLSLNLLVKYHKCLNYNNLIAGNTPRKYLFNKWGNTYHRVLVVTTGDTLKQNIYYTNGDTQEEKIYCTNGDTQNTWFVVQQLRTYTISYILGYNLHPDHSFILSCSQVLYNSPSFNATAI